MINLNPDIKQMSDYEIKMRVEHLHKREEETKQHGLGANEAGYELIFIWRDIAELNRELNSRG